MKKAVLKNRIVAIVIVVFLLSFALMFNPILETKPYVAIMLLLLTGLAGYLSFELFSVKYYKTSLNADERQKKNIAELSEDVDKKVFDLFLLNQLTRKLSSVLRMEELMPLIAETVVEMVRAVSGTLLLYDENRGEFKVSVRKVAENEMAEDVSDIRIKYDGFLKDIFANSEPKEYDFTSPTARVAGIDETETESYAKLGTKLVIPLMVASTPIGVLILGERLYKEPYKGSDMSNLSTIARYVSSTIYNAQLFGALKETQEKLDWKIGKLIVIQDMAQALASNLTMSDLVVGAVEVATGFMRQNRGMLYLSDDDGMSHTLKYMKDDSGKDTTVPEKIVFPSAFTRYFVKSNEAVLRRKLLGRKDIPENIQSRLLEFDCEIIKPLVVKGTLIGFILFGGGADENEYSEDDISFTNALCNIIAITIENARLYDVTLTESLTTVYSSAYFISRLKDKISKAKETGEPLSLAIIEIDEYMNFKERIGDSKIEYIMKDIARIMKYTFRDSDVVARCGDERFAVILSKSGSKDAGIPVQRLKDNIKKYSAPEFGVSIKCSIGIASYPGDTDSAEELKSKADTAVESAIQKGRNCVVLFGETFR